MFMDMLCIDELIISVCDFLWKDLCIDFKGRNSFLFLVVFNFFDIVFRELMLGLVYIVNEYV